MDDAPAPAVRHYLVARRRLPGNASVPVPDPTKRTARALLEGDVPTPVDIPSGCRFRTRCPIAVARCSEEEPVLREIASGHTVACHLVE